MTHRRRPYEQVDDIPSDDNVRRFDGRNNEGREYGTRWRQDDGEEGNNWENSNNCDESERKKQCNRGDGKNDRVDGWNERRENWGDKKANWEDRYNSWDDRKGNWEDKKKPWEERQGKREDRNDDRREDWNQRNSNSRDHWTDRKDGWNKRKDDPWDNRDDVDEGRGERGDSRDRRERDRERRNRSRDRRDRDRSRDRDHKSYRSSSRSPDREGNSQTSLAGEWICKCGALNFKRRVSCFRSRCGASRSEAVSVVSNQNKSINVKQQGTTVATMIATQQYTLDDIPALATYSAKIYAENRAEHSNYMKYYTDYYTQILLQKNSLEGKSETDKVNVAAAVAQSAISQVQAKANASATNTHTKAPPTGTDNKVYAVPDVTTYLYDQTSGYYYDPATGLYYDPNTQYYFNNQINQYLYWDNTKYTYVLASTLQNYNQNASSMANVTLNAPTDTSAESQPTDDKKGKTVEKPDKVKVAKKIAKDMERWARAMNQKKEISKIGSEPQANNSASSSKSADIGFSILDTQRVPASSTNNAQPSVVNQPAPLVPSYGGGSDSSGDESEPLIDWEKLACLLCKRQFPSRDVLEKHQLMSELHKQNLENLRGKHKGESSSRNRDGVAYRDRAAERRMKYGEDDEPIVRATRPDPIVPSVPREIGEENIGNRLLKKMGWTAGKGLGKEGQGILGPVEATTTGLGRKKGIYTAGPGETYRGCVKKLTMARYQDLIGSEGSS